MNETSLDMSPAEAGAVLSDLSSRAVSGEPTPEIREAEAQAREQASLDFLRDMRRLDACKRFAMACPPALAASDWSHARLEPFQPQIDRVLGHQVGAKGLLASGPTGRGKSRSMWALMQRLGCEEGLDVRYWSASDWFTTLQDHIRYGRDEARGWVNSVARRHIVFIDDYGQEAMQSAREDWARGWFFQFLDIRVGEGLPLFMTTNLTSQQMKDNAGPVRGDPLVRRLLDLCEPVVFLTQSERDAKTTRTKPL